MLWMAFGWTDAGGGGGGAIDRSWLRAWDVRDTGVFFLVCGRFAEVMDWSGFMAF